jgi:predicted naringenin-chalcone synthase
MATQFCLADPAAVVLIICLELCTLHFQITASIDTMLANSVFADGCSAALVSAKNLSGDRPSFVIGPSSSTLLKDGAKDMVWSIGNNGFDLVLSRYIPRIIGVNIRDLIESILEQNTLSPQEISLWAVHPGGKAILDKIQEHLHLEAWQIEASRNTLRTFGNMSSATIFFVLKDILHHHSAGKAEKVCALAFGPGLTVEVLILELS